MRISSVPGNARPVSIDLPKPGNEPINLFLHLESEPEIVKSSWSDKEGSLVELRLQKLSLATTPLTTPLPGVHLLRLRPWSEETARSCRVVAPLFWQREPEQLPGPLRD